VVLLPGPVQVVMKVGAGMKDHSQRCKRLNGECSYRFHVKIVFVELQAMNQVPACLRFESCECWVTQLLVADEVLVGDGIKQFLSHFDQHVTGRCSRHNGV